MADIDPLYRDISGFFDGANIARRQTKKFGDFAWKAWSRQSH